jgi:hypothetical protein
MFADELLPTSDVSDRTPGVGFGAHVPVNGALEQSRDAAERAVAA